MKVLSVAKARAMWILRLEELNPRGRYIYPLIDAIAERYGFLRYTRIGEIDPKDVTKPFSFTKGHFSNVSGEDIEVDLQIWNDGLVSDTRSSTDDSDKFLEDLLSWASKEFILTPNDLKKSRLYESMLWIHTEQSLALLNPKLQGIIEQINSLVREFSDRNLVYDMSAIGIWNDRVRAEHGYFSPFRFEKAEQVAFSENRYFSTAPVRTTDHIALLEELEQILAI